MLFSGDARRKSASRKTSTVEQPLFPRYLFISLGQGLSAQSRTPIQATKGVSRLIRFGNTPAKVDDVLIAFLRGQKVSVQAEPDHLLNKGEWIRITSGAFTDIEDIYQMTDGDQRVMGLIQMMIKDYRCLASSRSLPGIST